MGVHAGTTTTASSMYSSSRGVRGTHVKSKERVIVNWEGTHTTAVAGEERNGITGTFL